MGRVARSRPASAQATEPVEVGATVEVKVRLVNTGRTRVAWVLVEDLFPEHYLRQKPPRVRIKGRRMRLCSVPGGGSAVVKYEVECDTRGYYQLGPTLLETGDLFGLHRRHRIVAQPSFLMVLPKVRAAAEVRLRQRSGRSAR